jgi:hypothetical protein
MLSASVEKSRRVVSNGASGRLDRRRGAASMRAGARQVQGGAKAYMPRKHATLVAAAQRVAEARRIVANQQALIARLKVLRRSTDEAEAMLKVYQSALKNLENHEREIKQGLKAR